MTRATKHRSYTCVSLVDLSGRSSVQDTFLAIQVEETTATTIGVADNATTAKSGAAKETSTTEDSGNSHRQTQQNEKENWVAAKEGSCIEEECLQSTNSGLGSQLRGRGDDEGNGFKDRGTRSHDRSAARSGIPVAAILFEVSLQKLVNKGGKSDLRLRR